MHARNWLGLGIAALAPALVLAGDWKLPWKPAKRQTGSASASAPCDPKLDCQHNTSRHPCARKAEDDADDKECNYIAPRDVTSLSKINSRLRGRIVDYTYNHGFDRRILSHSLMEYRDLYVYLPPNYDRTQHYPLLIYLHGILQDERGFAEQVAPELDRAIVQGRMPPLIAVAPDGSLTGNPDRYAPGSFFINSPAGDFQDWVVVDVWNFVVSNYPIRPDPEAHILAGVSMGGFGAVNIGIKHRDKFRIVIAAMPVLNLRWMNLQGNYQADFDPYNWGWRNSAYDPEEVLGSFYNGWYKIRVKDLIYPVFGAGPDGIFLASQENPIEMIDRYKLKNGELDLFVGYGQQDEFNLDAQAESFLYFLKSRGIQATAYVDPEGTHSEETARKMMRPMISWLAQRLQARGVAGPIRYPQVKALP